MSHARSPQSQTLNTLKVVVSGSFKRAGAGLRSDFRQLTELGCQILSPLSVNFTTVVDGFAHTSETADHSPREIELTHLAAIKSADFVWLHAPEGYVGLSAALEVGHAYANGVPIFSREMPSDVTICEFVSVVRGPSDATDSLRRVQSQGNTPSAVFDALRTMQAYYRLAAAGRGYDSEGLGDIMILLMEELGELARAVRKELNLPRHGRPISKSIGDELSDVFLYVLHLANVAGVDLGDAVYEKELENAARATAKGKIDAK